MTIDKHGLKVAGKDSFLSGQQPEGGGTKAGLLHAEILKLPPKTSFPFCHQVGDGFSASLQGQS